jgi:DNA-binding HxlR family transcriptional regulator
MLSKAKAVERNRMAAKIALGQRSCREHLRRLAFVFAVELRLKIVTELYMREMSPTQFHREFGGGSASRVARNFDALRKHGWIRYIRSAAGREGKGKENFYRAPELAFIDAETWALVPYSMRVTSSWHIFNRIAARMRDAMESSCSAARRGRDLTSTPLVLDQVGWAQVIEALTTQFVYLFEEQKDAQLRIRHSGEKLIRADIFQVAFQAPTPIDTQMKSTLVERRNEPLVPLHERMSPVFADDICMRIVDELNRREMSVTLFYREFHRELSDVSIGALHRRFKRLKEIGWLAKVHEETGGRRRGATEVFYRATIPAIEENAPWVDISEALRGTKNWSTFQQLSGEVKKSMKAGTFDQRTDRCVAWSLVSLDNQGWEKVIADHDALLACALDEQDRAKHRMAKSNEQPIKMILAQAAFEAPKDVTKAP